MGFRARLAHVIDPTPSERVGYYSYAIGAGGIMPLPVKALEGGRGNPLYDAFHGIGAEDEGSFPDTAAGWARAYKSSAFAFRCVKILRTTLASISLEVRAAEDEPLPTHPLARVFADNNSRLMNWTEGDRQVFGRAYWTFGKTGVKRLNPQTIEVEADSSGMKGYVQRIDGSEVGRWGPRGLIDFPDYDPDNDFGTVSPMTAALRAVGVMVNVGRFADYFFRNGAMPDGILVSETRISDTDRQRIEVEWRRRFAGVENAHGTAVLDGGRLTYQPITPPIKDLAMTELREEDRREIAAAFGVPPTLALMTDAANYATAQEQRKSFYTETVLPELDALLDVINRDLLPQYGIAGAQVVPLLDKIEVLQEDRTEITGRNQQAISAGYMSLNEAREREGLDPLPQDIFIVAGKPVLRSAIEAGDLSVFAPVPAANPFGFASLPSLPDPERRSLAAWAGGETQPSRAIVDVVVRARDADEATQSLVHDTMLKDLERWQRKVAKKGVRTPFEPDYLPDGIADWLRSDLLAWDGVSDREAWVKRAFDLAAATVRAEDNDLATPEEFEAYWRGIGGLFDSIAHVFDAAWGDLPGLLATALRDAGAAGAAFDLQTFLDDFDRTVMSALLGTDDEPGPLVGVFLAGAARGNDLIEARKSVKQGTLTIDWTIVNTTAREWARQYSAELVRGINQTTLDIFRTKIAEWIDAGGSLEDLAKYIEGDLQGLDIPKGWSPGKIEWATSRERARLIAQTETTRAFHEGVLTRWEQVDVPRKRFRTQQDEHVCAICRPLNNQVTDLRGQWVHPRDGKTYTIPAHVGCRCLAAPELD